MRKILAAVFALAFIALLAGCKAYKDSSAGPVSETRLTMDKVIELSKKGRAGEEIIWSDFDGYDYEEVEDERLFTLRYDIDDDYYVDLAGHKCYVDLAAHRWEEHIDIRLVYKHDGHYVFIYEDVEEFVNRH